MSAPPEELWELICEHMATPGNLGCGHLRLMMQHPERYMVRAELLAEAFLRTICGCAGAACTSSST
jgi:hypothetical protein